MNDPVSNTQLRDAVRDAADALRNEFLAHTNGTGAQIGAVEKLLTARIDGLKWRMIAALTGGQVLAGLVAALVTRTTPAEAGRVALAIARQLV